MGRRNKDSNSAPCLEGSGLMPQKKPIEMSSSNFMKLVLFTLFDVSPAGAFLENTLDVVKGLPASTDSKKQLSNHQQSQSDRHLEASGSESAHGVKKRNSILGSTQHGGGRLLKVFRRKSSKSKRDLRETDNSNASSSDRDIYYSGDASSDSLFEIQVGGSLGTYNDYHDGQFRRDPQFRKKPLESEVEMLRRRLEKQEEEVQKLKDELSSLRSSSGSSQVESPSHSGTSGSEKCESFAYDRPGAVSPSESSRTSTTSDAFDGESQIIFEFRPSDEGQLVKLVRDEQTSWKIYKPQVSDGDVSFANVEKDVPLVRRSRSDSRICNSNVSDGDDSSANAEKEVAWVSHSSSSLYNQGLERDRTLEHMGTFLSDVAALSNKHGTLEKYTQKGIGFDCRGIGSQPDGPRRMILADQYTKEKVLELSLEVVPSISEGNCSDEDTSPLEHARERKQEARLETRSRFVSTNSSKTQDDECPFRPAEENQVVGVCSDERVESGKLQVLEDSERLSQEIEAPPRKMSIMDLRVHDHHDHDNPELAEIDRPSRLHGLRETSEKLMKIVLSSRRDNSYGTTSSSSGTSSPSSIASTSPRGSFMMTEDENSPVQADIPGNGYCNPSVESTLAPVCQSGMQETRVINDQIQNYIEHSSPRDILASKFGSKFGSLVRTRSLDLPRHIWEDVQAEISEEAVDTTPSVAGEVYFHPALSRELSFSVLTGYKQQRERTARGREISPAVVIDPGFRITEDKSAGKKLEEYANMHVPALCGPSGVPNTGSDCANGHDVRRLSWTSSTGSRLTRFGEEAAKLQSLAQAFSPDKLNCRRRYNRTSSCLPSEPGVNMDE